MSEAGLRPTRHVPAREIPVPRSISPAAQAAMAMQRPAPPPYPALDEDGTRIGAFAPEDWADPHAFYKALERVGTPPAEIVESVS